MFISIFKKFAVTISLVIVGSLTAIAISYAWNEPTTPPPSGGPAEGATLWSSSTGTNIYNTNLGTVSFGLTSPDLNYKITTTAGGIKAENSSASQPSGYFSNAGGGPSIVTGSGNVGIGTAGPSRLLEVQGNSKGVRFHDTNLYNNGQVGEVIQSVIDIGQDGSFPATASNRLGFRTRWLGGTEGLISAIDARHNAGWGGGLVFLTKNNDGNATGALQERMVINDLGNVGIGTTVPAELLQVGTESSGPTARKAIKIGSGGYGQPAAYQTNSNGDKIILYNADGYDARIGVGDGADLWFKSSIPSASTIMRIMPGGVGITGGNLTVNGSGNGIIFPDGSKQTTSLSSACTFCHISCGGSWPNFGGSFGSNYNSYGVVRGQNCAGEPSFINLTASSAILCCK